MDTNKIIDARGLSCPQPALMTLQTLQALPSGMITVLVDSIASRDNVSRIARKQGWIVNVETQSDGSFRLEMKK